MDTNPRHRIALVARRTGLSAHVLRAWERRYGVVHPARAPGGDRLYSDADVRWLELARRAVEGGLRISTVAALSLGELEEHARKQSSNASAVAPTTAMSTEGYADACIEALRQLDEGAAYSCLMRAAVGLGPHAFTHAVAVPLLTELGERWLAGDLRVAHEHVGSVAMRRALGWLLDSLLIRAAAPRIVCATPAGSRHEFGAMLGSILAASDGWAATYVGADLPADDIATAARSIGAVSVALSAIGPIAPKALREEVVRLRRSLPKDVSLIVGGHAAQRLVGMRGLEVVILDDLREFGDWLRANRPSGAASSSGR